MERIISSSKSDEVKNVPGGSLIQSRRANTALRALKSWTGQWSGPN